MTDRQDPDAFYRFPQPFFVESLPCENCGRPSEQRTWNAELQMYIGVDCPCLTEPDEPMCPELLAPILAARSVREIIEVCKAHRINCPVCGAMQGKRQSGPIPWRPQRNPDELRVRGPGGRRHDDTRTVGH